MTPQQQKRETQDAIIAITQEAAEREPLLELWEDLHWADPSTLELLGLLIEQAPTTSLLILLTARPEFVAPWSARSHIIPITLNRLERAHAEAMVTRLAGMKPLPTEVLDHIVTKTDGVPLYVEELTKTILASNILNDAGERYELSGPLSSLEIPDTLQESLMARLDRLPQVRELAQLGSVLGREFAYEMISGLSSAGDTLLQEGLGKLVEDELLYQRGRPPRAKYIFKHALLQDAAYASLLRRTRSQYHLQVAELLEARFAETVETHPELLAHHLTEAGEAERAIAYFQKAGEQCLHSSANVEAIAHLSRGLDLVAALPTDTERDQRELDLLMSIGPALIAVKGYAASEVEPAYRRALKLSQKLEDAPRQFSALHGIWFFNYARGDFDAARSLAEQLVDTAKGQNDSGLQLAAHRTLGYSLCHRGDLGAARLQLEQVITAYDPDVHGDFAFRHGGADPGSGSLTFSAFVFWSLGYPDQAIVRSEQALAMSQQLGHPFSEVWSLLAGAVVRQLRGESETTLAYATAASAIAEKQGFQFFVAFADDLRGWALGEEDPSSDGIAIIGRGLDAVRATGAKFWAPYFLTLRASYYGRLGNPQEGLVAVLEGLAEVARGGERLWEAELNRLNGELLLQSDAASDSTVQAQAEACLRSAIKIAQSQAAKSRELRAATSLAQLWQRQDKQDEARALLAPLYAWFTEGFETTDLKQARGLLDELEAPKSIALNAPSTKIR